MGLINRIYNLGVGVLRRTLRTTEPTSDLKTEADADDPDEPAGDRPPPVNTESVPDSVTPPEKAESEAEVQVTERDGVRRSL